MLHQHGRARLTAGLLAARRESVIDRFFAGGTAAAIAPPPVALFCAKDAVQAPRAPAPAAPTPASRAARLSLRLTEDQRWRLRLAAAYFRQSCQSFVVEALEHHIDRLARDPTHRGLGAAFAGASAANG